MHLILDLDHCLIYAAYSKLGADSPVSQRGYHYLYHRPGLFAFMQQLGRLNELQIHFYTSSKADYARWVLRTMDLSFSYTLFTRSKTKKTYTQYGEQYYKSLQRIGLQDSGEVFVVDDRPDLWNSEGISLFAISAWHGEQDDNELENVYLWIYKRYCTLYGHATAMGFASQVRRSLD